MNKNIVIFDLDGTLALIDHRRHLVEKPGPLFISKEDEEKAKSWKPDWDAFYEACVDDTLNEPVAMMFNLLRLNGYHLYILSGRSKSVEEQTKEWLNKHRIYCHKLFMRDVGSYIPDDTLKSIWLKEIGAENVFAVFDDRAKVVKAWRDAGLVCFQVADGDF
jgi:hypothetical protein